MKANYFIYSAALATTLFSSVACADATGSKNVSMQGGFAEATVTLHNDGSVIFETHAKSNSRTAGVKAEAFAKGIDKDGNVIYSSQVIRIPTACSKLDTCSSNVRGTAQESIDAGVAKNVVSLEVYIGGRGSLGPTLGETVDKARKVCATLHLPCSLL